MKTSIRLFTAALLSGSAALAVAQSPSSILQGPAPFTAFDYDGNGVIIEQEFNRFHSERMNLPGNRGMPMCNRPDVPVFAEADSDGNGAVSQEELTVYQQKRQQDRGAAAPQGPWRGGLNMPNFGEFDLNRDGVLEKEEFIEARGQRVARLASEGRMLRGLANMPDFETLDGNGDSLISPEEFYAHQAAHCRGAGKIEQPR